MPRELSKCREWEKDRRERLKKGFASLNKLLPCYEPSINLSKIDILQKAEEYIEELQTQIKELLDKKSSKTECSSIKKLSDRIKKLAIRNEQLCNLLIDAGIRLPSEYGNVKKFRGTRIWSNKITPEHAKRLLKKEKENEQKKVKKKVPNKVKRVRNSGLQKKLSKRSETNKQVVITNQLQSSNFITLVTTQSCFIITNAPSTNVNQNLSKTTTVLTNSNLYSTPLVASTVKPPLVITKSNNSPLNTVASGTLLVANGSILPIIQQPTLIPTPTIITNPTPIVVKSAPTNNTLFVVPKSDSKESSVNKSSTVASTSNTKTITKTTNTTKALTVLRPKISNVSHPNKLPIPSLASKIDDYISNVNTTHNTKSTKIKSNKNPRKEIHVKSSKEDNPRIEKDQEVKKLTTDTKDTSKIPPITHNDKCTIVDANDETEPMVKKPKLSPEINSDNNDDKRLNTVSAYTIDSLCNDLGDIPSTTNVETIADKVNTVKNVEKQISTDKKASNDSSNLEKHSEHCIITSQPELVTSETKLQGDNQTSIECNVLNNNEKNEEPLTNDKEKTKEQKNVEINNSLMHSDLSNDIFASLSHVSTGGQNPESTSPTAAFLLAFPLVSSLNSLKVTEVIEDEATESQHGTPTLLQIGTMDSTKTTQSHADNLTPSLLNLDNFSFFSREFYPSFEQIVTSTVCPTVTSGLTPSTAISTLSNVYSSVTTSPTIYPLVTSCSSMYSIVASSSSATYPVETSSTQPNTSSLSVYPTSPSLYSVSASSSILNSFTSAIVHTQGTSSSSAKCPVITSTIYSVAASTSRYPTATSSSITYSLATPSSIYPTVISSSFIYPVVTSSVYSTASSSSSVYSAITSSSSAIYPTITSSSSSSVIRSAVTSSVYPSITSTILPTITCSSAVTSSVFPTISSSSMHPTITSSSTIYPAVTSSIYPITTSSSSIYPAVTSSVYPEVTFCTSTVYPVVTSSVYLSVTSSSTTYSTSSVSSVISTSPFAYPCVTSSIYSGVTTSSVTYPVITSSSIYATITSSSAVYPIVTSTYAVVTTSVALPLLNLSSTVYPVTTASIRSLPHSSCSTTSSVTKIADNRKDFSEYNINDNGKKSSNSEINSKIDMKFALKSTPIKDSFSYVNGNKICSIQNSASVNQSGITRVASTNSYIKCTTADYNLPYSHPFYSNAQTITTSATTTITSAKHQIEKSKMNEKKACDYYPTTTSYSIPQYNTFNPFTDIPKTTTTYSITTRAYNDTLYTNNTTYSSAYSYNYHHDNFTPSYSSTKSNIKPDKLYYPLNYENYEYKSNEFQKYDSRNQQFGNYYGQNNIQSKEKSNELNKSNLAINSNANKVPVNWMTAPDIRHQLQNDLVVPSLGKDVDFPPNTIYSTNSFSASQTTYFNTNSSLYTTSDIHSTPPFPAIPPNSFQRNDVEDNQFSWSPSKLPQLLDASHNFVSSTLPTLVGDLALGNTQSFVDQKIEKNIKDCKLKENTRKSKPQTNYDSNQSNFLSVSQLVDHNKNDTVPERVTNRRNSGNRSSKSSIGGKSTKRVSKTEKDIHYGNNNNKVDKQMKRNTNQEYQSQPNENNASWITTNKNRNIKIPSNNYSAEALIGHQNQTETIRTRNSQNYAVNKSLPVPFLTDNIISYFPMDVPQDNTLTQQNQNYQSTSAFGHNFTSSIQGSVYSSNSFVPTPAPITTSYLSSTNFITDIGSGTDYTPIIPDNTFSHVINRPSDKFSKSKPLQNEKHGDKRNIMPTNNNCLINPLSATKKSKKKPNNEPNLSNFDFSFLSVPSAINSPILPDDFHAHSNFLPPPTPTQLYPCKNPLYGKQDIPTNSLLPLHTSTRTGIPHPEASPSLNNVGTTLTNFNLSAIFPEINKVPGPLPDGYSNNGKTKEYNQREFLGSTSQVPFKSNMSYINSPTSNNN